MLLVHKKDGSMRLCKNYRRLNEVKLKDAYRLPNIEEAFDHLSGHALFSTLKINSDTVVTFKGLFLFKAMPLGLTCTCALAKFKRFMEMVLAGIQYDKCLVYLDDITVIGKSFDDMLCNMKGYLIDY